MKEYFSSLFWSSSERPERTKTYASAVVVVLCHTLCMAEKNSLVMRIARPKKYKSEKGKKRTIRVSEKAAFILSKLPKHFNLSDFVSRKLVQDYEDPTQYLKQKIAENQQEIDKLYAQNQALANKIKNIKEEGDE